MDGKPDRRPIARAEVGRGPRSSERHTLSPSYHEHQCVALGPIVSNAGGMRFCLGARRRNKPRLLEQEVCA